MKVSVTNDDLVSQCRSALAHFWTDMLKVETAREGVNIALPLLYPDGLQVLANLRLLGEKTALLTDRGEVLGNLMNSGLNLESDSREGAKVGLRNRVYRCG